MKAYVPEFLLFSDPFRLTLALGPLTLYLMLLGLRMIARRARVTHGAFDTIALGVALCGLVLVGPVELLLPRRLLAAMGGGAWMVWASWLALYASIVCLLALVQPLRLTIHNVPPARLATLLGDAVRGLDPSARWSGDLLIAPNLGVHAKADPFPTLGSVSVVAVGEHQDPAGWRRLETAIRQVLASETVSPQPQGFVLMLVALLILTTVALNGFTQPELIAKGARAMLRM